MKPQIVLLLISLMLCTALTKAAAGYIEYPLSSIVIDMQREPRGDGYTESEHRGNFWGIHERFGFLSENGATYLVARDAKIYKSVVQNLNDAKAFIDQETISTKIPPFKKNKPVDVTALIPNRFQNFNEFYPSMNGPNCWNLALYFSEVSASIHETLPEEFKFWLESPLARTLTSVDMVKPGDIMVFRQGNEEVHAAVFISPDLVLSKNGTEETRPYRIMDLNEMATQYTNEHPAYGITLSNNWFIVRLSSLRNYLATNDSKITGIVAKAYEDLMTLEEKVNQATLSGTKATISKKEVKAAVASFKLQYQAVLQLEVQRTSNQPEQVFLATAILKHLESLSSF